MPQDTVPTVLRGSGVLGMLQGSVVDLITGYTSPLNEILLP